VVEQGQEECNNREPHSEKSDHPLSSAENGLQLDGALTGVLGGVVEFPGGGKLYDVLVSRLYSRCKVHGSVVYIATRDLSRQLSWDEGRSIILPSRSMNMHPFPFDVDEVFINIFGPTVCCRCF